jgi:fumarate reductase flavoprotein subunit
LAAALAAAEAGGSVLVLEKLPQPGGTTGIAVGSFTAAGTSLQRRAGVVDDARAHAEDVGRFAPPDLEARNNDLLRRLFVERAAETFEWLSGHGLRFHGPSPEPPNRAPRMHNVVPGAKAYIAALQLAVQRRGGVIRCGCPATGLITTDGRVTGVRADDGGTPREFIARRGVVLAAGDYASGGDLIAAHKGDRFRTIEGINPHATGDGHRLAAAAGGELVNMDVTYGPELRFVAPPGKPFQQLLPSGGLAARLMGAVMRLLPKRVEAALVKRLLVTWQHPEDLLFTDGAILVNADGRRFVDELRSPDREVATAGQPGKMAYLLLDGRLVEQYSAWPHFISTAPDIAYAYVKDYQRLRPDVTAVASDLTAVVGVRGLDPGHLAATVDEYNRQLRAGVPDPFGRAVGAPPLGPGPWALLGPVKAYFTTTEGGARITSRLEVVGADGRPIPGLYAVGQNGLGGMVLWGHGLHIAWALTSGRLGGREAMSEH